MRWAGSSFAEASALMACLASAMAVSAFVRGLPRSRRTSHHVPAASRIRKAIKPICLRRSIEIRYQSTLSDDLAVFFAAIIRRNAYSTGVSNAERRRRIADRGPRSLDCLLYTSDAAD